MSRKQEVIKIFRGRLAQARCFSLYDAQHGAECLYDLIAPLMVREFPEGAVARELRWVFHAAIFLPTPDQGDIDMVNDLQIKRERLIETSTNVFKRLWEGQPENVESVRTIPLSHDDIKTALEKELPELERRLEKLEEANRSDPRKLDMKIIGEPKGNHEK